MSLWAIIPVKPLRRGKSRLSGVLSEDERALLNYTMLSNTLKTLAEVPEISERLVVSRDPAALALAREYGARTLQEDGNPGLNTALRRATVVAQVYSASGILIMPADLPLLSQSDVRELISYTDKPPVVVIAPDRRRDGTNALLTTPAGLIEYHFGPGSFQKHVQLAERQNVRVEVCSLSTLGLDLDYPEDLELLRQMKALQVDI
ncbi:MAG TPA: 2-phospho-L-lactate guanylyltransferase [Anaerolineaceae bacterium]